MLGSALGSCFDIAVRSRSGYTYSSSSARSGRLDQYPVGGLEAELERVALLGLDAHRLGQLVSLAHDQRAAGLQPLALEQLQELGALVGDAGHAQAVADRAGPQAVLAHVGHLPGGGRDRVAVGVDRRVA